ncbi:hypothetical protein LCGC14_1422310 [marine sediment metagenome]|uniref:Efflux RND transporter periplasmic adaptor subunit n=2 Tax=root TaxID=1 RepID=A0A831VN44_9FLAO|nr:efflux RND transporter periplasmic adaptor subunit [Pricia antarctica]
MTYNFRTSLLVFLLLLLYSCGNSGDEAEKENSDNKNTDVSSASDSVTITQSQFDGSNMKLGSLSERSFPVVVEATGTIDVPPENKAMVSSFVNGYVKQTPLLIGDTVKKGQFLVSLENPEFVQIQQDYIEAMEQSSFLKSEYERQKTLMDENITSEKRFLQAESEYKRNLSRYNAMRKKLQMLNIDPQAVEDGEISSTIRLYAPITGSITEMKINRGMYVSAADELMQIIDRDHLHIELNVFEKDIMQLKKGQDIRFSIPEASNDTIEGEVHLVGASIDEAKRTVKVHGHFRDETQKHLATGMFVQAEIITASNKAMSLPSESIVNVDETSFVLILQSENDGKYIFKRLEVMSGKSYDGFTEIKNGSDFKENDRILVKGAFSLITGA